MPPHVMLCHAQPVLQRGSVKYLYDGINLSTTFIYSTHHRCSSPELALDIITTPLRSPRTNKSLLRYHMPHLQRHHPHPSINRDRQRRYISLSHDLTGDGSSSRFTVPRLCRTCQPHSTAANMSYVMAPGYHCLAASPCACVPVCLCACVPVFFSSHVCLGFLTWVSLLICLPPVTTLLSPLLPGLESERFLRRLEHAHARTTRRHTSNNVCTTPRPRPSATSHCMMLNAAR